MDKTLWIEAKHKYDSKNMHLQWLNEFADM